MATYQSIKHDLDYGGKAGALMPLLTFTSDGSDATAQFTTKIDSTYDEYLFILNNIHGETADTHMAWQCNAVGGSGFNETITSSAFISKHSEDDGTANLGYTTYGDQAQGTGNIRLTHSNNENDQAQSGWLRIYNPANTTFVKSFLSRVGGVEETPQIYDWFAAGYINTTTAIDEVQFYFSSGEIQGGTIQMFGVH